MKKRPVFLVIICFIILLSSCNKGNSPVASDLIQQSPGKISLENSDEIFDIAVDKNENIYVANQKSVDIYDKTGKKVKTISEDFNLCLAICVADDLLYVLEPVKGGSILKAINLNSGTKVKEYNIPVSNITNKMECMGDKFLLLHYDSDNRKELLSVYDLSTNKLETLDLKSFYGFCRYKDNSIMYYDTAARKLIIYDTDKMEILESWDLDSPTYNIYYSSTDDIIYYFDSNDIGTITFENGQKEVVYTKSDASFDKLLVSDNIIFILDRKNKAIYCIEKEEILKQNNQKSISILSPGELNGYCIDKTLEIFEKKYPDVKVKRTALGDSYYTTLSTKLMSGDKDPDILLLHNLKINDFARNKCLLDLNAYPEIKDKFSKMFTGIEQLCTSYGSLTGVPYLLDIMAWAVNEDLLKRLNIELPGDSWTWNDFYEYAKKVRKDINGDGIKDTYIIEAEVRVPYFLDLYESIHIDAINAQVNIDRQELKDLLIIWKKLWDEDLLKPGRMKGHEEDDVLLYHIDMSLALGDATIIYPPHLEHERKYYAQFYALCINNNSENKELAVEFLSTYLSEEVQKHNPVDAIYKDRSIYENSQYFIDAAKFSNDSPFGKMSNDRNYEIYKTMLENSCASSGIPADLRIFMINTIEKHIRNEIDVDEAVSLIEQKAYMIIGE